MAKLFIDRPPINLLPDNQFLKLLPENFQSWKVQKISGCIKLGLQVWTPTSLQILKMFMIDAKGGFFSESAMCFLDLQISKKNIPKNYPELEI